MTSSLTSPTRMLKSPTMASGTAYVETRSNKWQNSLKNAVITRYDPGLQKDDGDGVERGVIYVRNNCLEDCELRRASYCTSRTHPQFVFNDAGRVRSTLRCSVACEAITSGQSTP